jgi:hypothetical protein
VHVQFTHEMLCEDVITFQSPKKLHGVFNIINHLLVNIL